MLLEHPGRLRPVNDIAALTSSTTAVVATAVSLFLLRQGQVDRRELRHEKARERATHVTAWADWHDSELATFAKPQLPAILVANSSAAAVFDVFVDYRTPTGGLPVRATIEPVPPGETRLRVIDYEGQLEDGWEPAALLPRVYFRDSAGKRWLRDATGRHYEDRDWAMTTSSRTAAYC
jgi:hypothetical protein